MGQGSPPSAFEASPDGKCMARQSQGKTGLRRGHVLDSGRTGLPKINKHSSSCVALIFPLPVDVSQLESGLCLEINKLAPLSAWDFPLSGDTHKPPPEMRGFFPAAENSGKKEEGL